MPKRFRRHKCRCCRKLYTPDPRSRHNQKHCSDSKCRKAGKAASQRKWRQSDKGRNYFRGPANALRVKLWRQEHPEYAAKRKKPSRALQGDSPPQTLAPPADKPPLNVDPTPDTRGVQEDTRTNRLLLTGLIVHFTGALQDEIAPMIERLVRLGQQYSGPATGVPDAGSQASALQGAVAQSPPAVQLDRPSSGP